MNLSQKTFNNLISVGNLGSNLTAITFVDGTKGYQGSIGFYGNSRYDYMLGNSTVYYNLNKNMGLVNFREVFFLIL